MIEEDIDWNVMIWEIKFSPATNAISVDIKTQKHAIKILNISVSYDRDKDSFEIELPENFSSSSFITKYTLEFENIIDWINIKRKIESEIRSLDWLMMFFKEN